MEYILVMTLSGSTMTIIYLLAKYLLRDRISARLHYLVAKAAVLYYLIPLPFLKSWYIKIIRAVMPRERTESVQLTLRWTNYVLHSEEKLYLNIYAKLQIAAITVWLSVACFLLLRQIWEYLQTVRWFVKHADRNMTESQKAVLESLKGEYRIKRRVLLFQGQDGEPTMTFGIFRPVILCGRDVESREAELLIRHEMVHIKRWDILWKVFVQLVRLMYWWNPLARFLFEDFERVSEWACDETVMRGRSDEEVNEYLLLLIEAARNSGKPKDSKLRWRAGFGDNAKKLRERMDNLMNRKKWNKVVAGVLVTVLALANSITVFAYRDVHQEVMPESTSQEEIEKMLDRDTFMFDPDGTSEGHSQEFAMIEDMEELEIRYDNQFTDNEGNIYPITDPVQRGCNHNYVSGTATGHNKYSDGSCEVTKHHAQRCDKCGLVVYGDLISTHTYTVCPHE